ncbi:amidohydrolase family protein [Iamia majanohamensis]|uniref:Amidohydrolase family protein n=1 Tax=Iamia majanohamensis TaxID=467976 RepID=A0AAE9Y4M7_9ACTN|nr:amidohydrolase family protein [Iamia majanohamensis]WCO66120.1 amidohydrolase family protein [Iamia majanohamensis]
MATSSEIRAELAHPVIDADGHVLEYLPAVEPHLREALGPAAFDRYRSASSPLQRIMEADTEARLATRTPQSAWWGTPAAASDLATAAAPALMHERMDELGLDVAVLYPTKGFGIAGIADDELRAGVCRGFNEFYAATYGPYADRLTVAGVIPMHTPTEALEGLAHCAELGFKVVAFPEGVTREIPEPVLEGGSPFLLPGQRHWFDSFGLDSAYDYDPVWARARELGFAVTFHGGLGHMPTGSFTSVSNYSSNHVGSFAQRMHTLVKSLFMGGVTRRHPDQGFAVLECGVGWAAILLNDLVDHWEKRRPEGLEALDPAGIDWDELEALMRRHAPDLLAAGDDVRAGLATIPGIGVPPAERDEWRHLGASTSGELVDLFAGSFYFGCEADDRTIAYAFSPANHDGFTLRPIFSSDIGHWDAGDPAGVVAEAFELVEDGILTEAQLAELVYENPARLFLDQNPDFFVGTPVADHAATLVDA